jgi:hypothetical protein
MSPRKKPPQPQTPTTSPTQIYTVQSLHFSHAPLAADLGYLDEIAAVHASNEFERLIDLIVTREIVPLSPLDHVEVIDHALTTVHVRVVDGAERGRQGWIPSSWLHVAGTAVITADELLVAAQAA